MPDNIEPLVLVCGTETLELTPARLRKLGELIDFELELDAARDSIVGAKPPLLRLAHADGSIVHPIACDPRIYAGMDKKPLPECRWREQDDGTFACQLCDHVVRIGEPRHVELALLFGEGGLTPRERKLIVAVLRAIAAAPRDLGATLDLESELEGFAARLLDLEPGALAVVRQALSEIDG
ncbi:MAG TPA: hypothetical protein VM869_35810 [Enhygromyxa sp.]|nr:hypothetical protein [Enhygromyxa sp.]